MPAILNKKSFLVLKFPDIFNLELKIFPFLFLSFFMSRTRDVPVCSVLNWGQLFLVSNSRGFHFCYFWSRTQDVVLSSFLVLQSGQHFVLKLETLPCFLGLEPKTAFCLFLSVSFFFSFFLVSNSRRLFCSWNQDNFFLFLFFFFVSNSRRFFFLVLIFWLLLNSWLFFQVLFLFNHSSIRSSFVLGVH